MGAVNWIELIVLLTFSGVFILLIKRLWASRSLIYLYFGLASLAIAIPYFTLSFSLSTTFNILEWGKLISITIYISGLLALVREYKPIFARFPAYLTALPFISILFFPLIIDTIVIRNLINAIYQGGAIVVTILVFTLNNARKTGRRYYTIGLSMILLAYAGYWFYFKTSNTDNLIWISEIVLSMGILITLYRFIRSTDQNKNT
ncbi:hypothetical protein [Gracilimonas sp.]|uniref:hypothetical protein n=1 Tax=Gracilimonas sp. TaxID=1974203 RepID=UPI002872A755|nr:hypothetical protein [Gracilimonas sp.]